MNQKSLIFIALLLGVSGLSACSGGSGRNYGGGGLYCDANQANAFALPTSAQKVSLSPGDANLTPGKYVYDFADLLYVYKPNPNAPREWVIVQTTENNFAGQKPATQGLYCARGILPQTPAFSAGADGISQMTVAEDGSVSYEVRQFSFAWNPEVERIDVSAKALGEDVSNPTKVYTGKATDFNFYKLQGGNDNDLNYEILSETHYPEQNLSIYLRIRMVRQPLAE